VSLALVVTLTRAYPEEPPGIEVRWDGLEEGLSESRYPELYGVLQRQVRSNSPSSLLFPSNVTVSQSSLYACVRARELIQARENLGSFIISEIIETARAWLIGAWHLTSCRATSSS
jgi:hypothetical protein